MPDIKKIYELIRLIQDEEEMTLDMETSYYNTTSCGTVGCIMGFVHHHYGGSVTTENVAEHLGISPVLANELCWADSLDGDGDHDLEDLTKPIVIAALEDLAAGQFTDWRPYL